MNADPQARVEANQPDIDPAIAARLQAAYDFQLCTGRHSFGSRMQHLGGAPTQLEYDEAKSVVSRLGPGDTLFIEEWGHGGKDEIPLNPVTIDASQRDYDQRGWAVNVREAYQEYAEEQRLLHRISAWDYAHILAAVNGVTIIQADISATELEQLSMQDDALLSDEAWQELQTMREAIACQTVIDYALQHLEETEAQIAQGGERPKLCLLFGRYHTEGLLGRFTSYGIKVDDIRLRVPEESDQV